MILSSKNENHDNNSTSKEKKVKPKAIEVAEELKKKQAANQNKLM